MRKLWAKQNGDVAGCENSQPRTYDFLFFFIFITNIFKDQKFFFFKQNIFKDQIFFSQIYIYIYKRKKISHCSCYSALPFVIFLRIPSRTLLQWFVKFLNLLRNFAISKFRNPCENCWVLLFGSCISPAAKI